MLWSDVPNIRKISSSVSEAMICPVKIKIKINRLVSSPKYATKQQRGCKKKKGEVGLECLSEQLSALRYPVLIAAGTEAEKRKKYASWAAGTHCERKEPLGPGAPDERHRNVRSDSICQAAQPSPVPCPQIWRTYHGVLVAPVLHATDKLRRYAPSCRYNTKGWVPPHCTFVRHHPPPALPLSYLSLAPPPPPFPPLQVWPWRHSSGGVTRCDPISVVDPFVLPLPCTLLPHRNMSLVAPRRQCAGVGEEVLGQGRDPCPHKAMQSDKDRVTLAREIRVL